MEVRFRIFSKAEPGDRRTFSNERFLVLDYTLSELLAVVAAAWWSQAAATVGVGLLSCWAVGLLGCVSVTRVSSMEVP